MADMYRRGRTTTVIVIARNNETRGCHSDVVAMATMQQECNRARRRTKNNHCCKTNKNRASVCGKMRVNIHAFQLDNAMYKGGGEGRGERGREGGEGKEGEGRREWGGE